MKLLSDKELGHLRELDSKVEISKANLALSLLKIQNLELKQKIISLELMQQKNDLEILRSQEKETKIIRQDALKTLQKKHKLKDGWGFNPDSGEIVDGGDK